MPIRNGLLYADNEPGACIDFIKADECKETGVAPDTLIRVAIWFQGHGDDKVLTKTRYFSSEMSCHHQMKNDRPRLERALMHVQEERYERVSLKVYQLCDDFGDHYYLAKSEDDAIELNLFRFNILKKHKYKYIKERFRHISELPDEFTVCWYDGLGYALTGTPHEQIAVKVEEIKRTHPRGLIASSELLGQEQSQK